MKDVLTFNLQRFGKVQIGTQSYTSLSDAFTSGATGSTIVFLENNSETNVALSSKTFTLNFDSYAFTGDVDLNNAGLTIGTESSKALTFNGTYEVKGQNATTFTLNDFDNANGVKDKVTAGGNFTSDFKFDNFVLQGLTATSNAYAWSNTATNAYAWQNEVTAGATATTNTIAYVDSGTTKYFDITNINDPGTDLKPDASNTLTLSLANLIAGSSVTLTNAGAYAYKLALADDASGTTVTPSVPAWEYSSGTASYLSYSTSTGFVPAGDTQINYNTEYASTTYTALTGVKGIAGLEIDLPTSSVTVANASLSETTVTASNGFTLALGNDVTQTSVVGAAFGELSSNTAVYFGAYDSAGYKLNDSATAISYIAEGTPDSLFTMTGIISVAGLEPDASNTFKIGSDYLGGSNVTLANAEGYTYKLSLDTTTATLATFEAADWTYSASTATFLTAITNTGYAQASDYEINFYANAGGDSVTAVYGVISASGLTLNESDKIVTVGSSALSTAEVTTIDGWKLALGADVTQTSVVGAAFGALSASNTAVYYGAYDAAGYKLNDSQTSISYVNEGTPDELFNLTGIASTDTADVNVNSSTGIVTVYAKALIDGSNVTIADNYTADSTTYKLAMGNDVAQYAFTDAGFTAVASKSTSYETFHSTAGYSMEDSESTTITYTAGVNADTLLKITGLDTSTDNLSFDSATNKLELKAALDGDVITILNSSSSDMTVTNNGAEFTLASNTSIVADYNWGYQDGKLTYGDASLTNVGNITENTADADIALSNKVLTLATGIDVNDSKAETPSVAENLDSVVAGITTYKVTDSDNYLEVGAVNSDISVIKFDGKDVTFYNSSDAQITGIENSDTYATKSDGVLVLGANGRSSDITVVNSSDDSSVYVSDSYIVSLSKSDSMAGNGTGFEYSESWKYQGTTLINGTESVSLTGVAGITTDVTVTTSSDSTATLQGTGISYIGATTTSTDAVIVAATSDVTVTSGAISLAQNSDVALTGSATIGGVYLGTINLTDARATMGSGVDCRKHCNRYKGSHIGRRR